MSFPDCEGIPIGSQLEVSCGQGDDEREVVVTLKRTWGRPKKVRCGTRGRPRKFSMGGYGELPTDEDVSNVCDLLTLDAASQRGVDLCDSRSTDAVSQSFVDDRQPEGVMTRARRAFALGKHGGVKYKCDDAIAFQDLVDQIAAKMDL